MALYVNGEVFYTKNSTTHCNIEFMRVNVNNNIDSKPVNFKRIANSDEGQPHAYGLDEMND